VGELHYGPDMPSIELPDRVLAHLQLVIGAKLRRRESFYLRIREVDGSPSIALWIAHSIQLQFRYQHLQPLEIDREWLRDLEEQSFTPAGIIISADDDTE